METTKEKISKSKLKLKVKVSSSEMRTFFARVYNKLAPQIQVKGFRSGAAPKSMIISAIGENRIQSEIIDLALQETYPMALKKENIIPILPPSINITLLKDLTVDTPELEYEAEIELLPEIKLGDYKKIRIKKDFDKNIIVSDDEIDQVLSHLARGKATFTEITRGVVSGDRIEINFNGFDNGVKLENFSSQNYPVILGSKVLIPEFEDNLIGLKKGDKKSFKIEVKTSETEKKKINFEVEVLQTQEVNLPKIDNDFAKIFKKNDLETLKQDIKNDVLKQKKIEKHQALENAVLEELLKIVKVDVPESLINQEVERQINEITKRLEPMGMTFLKYLENMKKTEEQFRSDLKPQSEKTIKIGLALGEIVKAESTNWRIDPMDKEAGKKVLDKLTELALK